MSLISAYLRDVVTHSMSNGNDEWGTPIAPTEVTNRMAWINYGSKRVTNRDGDLVVSTACLKIDPNVTVTYEDTFTFDGDTYNIINIKKPRDFNVQFQEVSVA